MYLRIFLSGLKNGLKINSNVLATGENAGAAGKLYAEAGTPTGQLARAGLGGSVDDKGRASGGLFAGATAGGNMGASAGLAGGVNENKAEGGGFAAAQAGKHIATSALGGQSSNTGSSGFSYSNNNKIEAANEIKPQIDTTANFEVNANAGIEKNVVPGDVQPTVIVKEVYVQPKVKHHHRVKPAKTYITYEEPKIEKRIDTAVEGSANVDASVAANAGANVNQVYTKQVSLQRNPAFFQDIFNIPISAISAVRNFLGDTAQNTNISVQKTASVNAETGIATAKDAHSPTLLKSSQSSAHVSVDTPSANQFLDGIFSIPINTLGAVSKFLENNVPVRKTIQTDGSGEIRLRGGRRRANKRVIITNQPQTPGAADDEQQ